MIGRLNYSKDPIGVGYEKFQSSRVQDESQHQIFFATKGG